MFLPLSLPSTQFSKIIADMHIPIVVCFGLLMSELALFTTIVCPMPFSVRKKSVTRDFEPDMMLICNQDVPLLEREPGCEQPTLP